MLPANDDVISAVAAQQATSASRRQCRAAREAYWAEIDVHQTPELPDPYRFVCHSYSACASVHALMEMT